MEAEKYMAAAFAGTVLALIGAIVGGAVGFNVTHFEEAEVDRYLMHIPTFIAKAFGTVLGAFMGSVVGFGLGTFAYSIVRNRGDRTEKQDANE